MSSPIINEFINEFGDKYWHKDEKYHRLDGPAIEYSNGSKYWYIEGKYIECNSQKEFEIFLKFKAFW